MSEVSWPMGMDRDLSTRPLVFNPEGFLVAMLEDDEAAQEARAGLEDAGFASDDLRVYRSKEILKDHDRFLAERSMTRRVVGAITDDPASIELYFDYAEAGRAALWVHVPDERDASRAIRGLTDHKVLHVRHYGKDTQEDIHIE
jgi:hypothetical protein